MQRKILNQLPNYPRSPNYDLIKSTLTNIIVKLQETNKEKYFHYSQTFKQISWSIGKCEPNWPQQVQQMIMKLKNQLSNFQSQLINQQNVRSKSVWLCGSSNNKGKQDVLELVYKRVLAYQNIFPIISIYQDRKIRQDLVSNILQIINKNKTLGSPNSISRKSFKQQQQTNSQFKQNKLQSKSKQMCNYCQLMKSISICPNGYLTKKYLKQLDDVEWIAGILYQQGKIVDKNVNKAIKYYQIAKKKRNPEAFYRLGSLNQKGQYGTQLQYLKLWDQAAKMGHLQSMTDLGYLYQNGLQENGRKIIPSNPQKSLQYYSSAAQKNFPRALNNLASFYFNNPKYKNQEKCMQYFQRAADAQYVKSLYNLGIIHLQGQIGQKNTEKAKSLIKRAAQKGDIQAKQQYIQIMLNDIEKCTQDDLDQINMYCRQIIAQQEDTPYPYYFLGIMYEAGYGVPQEPKTALLYYTKAVKYQCPQAYIKLADCFKNGFGVEQNSKQAINYYQKAAKSLPEAYVYIGQMYQKGYPDLKQNYQMAYNFYSNACNNQVPEGYTHIGNMYRYGRHVRKDQGKAQQYFSKGNNSLKKTISRLSVSNQLISSSYFRSKK